MAYNNDHILPTGEILNLYNGKPRTISVSEPLGIIRSNIYLNGVYVFTSVAHAVATVHIPNPDNLPYVKHRDGNADNNHVDNLYWCSAKDHMKDIERVKGEDAPAHKLTEAEVLEIKDLLHVMRPCDIADMFNISRSTLCDIKYGRTWKHLL